MRGDTEQQVQIAHHLIRFRCNGNAQPLARSHLLENRAGGPEFPLGGLIRVSGRTDGDVLALNLFHSQVAPGKRSGILLDVDLPFEISGIQFHVFMCVSRVTVLASEFTATIGFTVQENGTRSESQWFKIERTGKRKYSVPRLASARGEEEARRAMPTRSGRDPGGSRASGPVSRWIGTSGKRVGVESFLRPRRTPL